MRAPITHAGLLIALILSLVGTTPLSSATLQVAEPGPSESPSPSGPIVGICGAAIPVTGLIDGQGASWAQLYYDPIFAVVYASWSLETHTMNNGADKFVFGFVVTDAEFNELTEGVVFDFQAGVCVPLTNWWDSEFRYIVEAGAVGWFGQSSCGIEFHWEAYVGVMVDVFGPHGEGSIALGGSTTCESGETIDSEILIYAAGKACLGCYIPPSRG